MADTPEKISGVAEEPPGPEAGRPPDRGAAAPRMTKESDAAGRVLVAGIGNLFLGDDGFGPEVVRRLAHDGGMPPQVRLVDYGIRGMHLAYDLLDGYDALVLVDAYPGGDAPGEVTVLRIGVEDLGSGEFDAHGMNPVAVLSNLDQMGGTLPLTYLVGCTPAGVEEGIGLSETVDSAVPEAMRAVHTLVRQLAPSVPTASVNSADPRRS